MAIVQQRRGREARRAERLHAPIVQKRTLVRDIPLYELLDAEGLEVVHDASMTVLEEIGIEFRDGEALALWRAAGADVKGQRVRLPRELVLAKLSTLPATFVQHARNPERSVTIGGRHTVFAPTYGSPFVRGFDNVRRYGTIEDLRNFVKLAYLTPHIHHSGGVICEPVDVPVPKRHLEMVYTHIKHSDKPFMGMVTAQERAEDTVTMARLLFGEAFVERNCVLVSVVNCNSPLVWDGTMLAALKVYARANQAVLVTPFIMAGAMSPASTAGAVAQLNAEVVAGLAFTQLVRPGAPMVYGCFVSTVSMQSGAPMMGTPEPAQMIYLSTQLARKYKVPVRAGGMLCGSKIADAQAAYESVQTMIPTLLGGTNFVLHSAGWLEAGLCAGYGKFVLDADQVGMLERFAHGVDLGPEGLAMDALREVGPGGHYLGCAHTRRHYTTAFYLPATCDNNSYEQWQAEGEFDANARALVTARRMLDEYEAPPLDLGIDEALCAFIAKRKAELPDDVS
ncbi:MAG: trimethylamine methyltransferase family protein [Alphaproteobacteria bacterium]|nr:trimethylamine methyltransferase family protein [Alphaproteobacteria bacterium]